MVRSLPGLVAPVSVVPSAVPLWVPAFGVIPEEKPVCGEAALPAVSCAAKAKLAGEAATATISRSR